MTVALLIDEAQSLSDELLEELRMLTNIETHSEKLLTLILVGQPQLADRLNDERLGQLKQRVELRCTLTPFDLPETSAYIWTRIRTAGGDGVKLFSRDALAVIHERSRGIPRSISVICENALISAFADNQCSVTQRLVREVCDELDLRGPAFAPSGGVVGTLSAPTSNHRPSYDGPGEARSFERVMQPASNEQFPFSGRRNRTSVVAVFIGRLAIMNRIDRALKRRDSERGSSPAHESGVKPLPPPPSDEYQDVPPDLLDRFSREPHRPDVMRQPPVGSERFVDVLSTAGPELSATRRVPRLPPRNSWNGRRGPENGSTVGRAVPTPCGRAPPGAGRAWNQESHGGQRRGGRREDADSAEPGADAE